MKIINASQLEFETIACLIENEINSNTDYLNDVPKKEIEYWKNQILILKNLQEKLNG